jgi:hypothetical protein
VHITLQLAIQIATLVSVILGFLGLINTVNSYRRQMNVQILMKYTERYERILDQFPREALAARFDTKALPPESPQLTMCVLKYLNLCSEEYYLTRHGYLSESLWRIWEGDLKRIIGSPSGRESGSLYGPSFCHIEISWSMWSRCRPNAGPQTRLMP